MIIIDIILFNLFCIWKYIQASAQISNNIYTLLSRNYLLFRVSKYLNVSIIFYDSIPLYII